MKCFFFLFFFSINQLLYSGCISLPVEGAGGWLSLEATFEEVLAAQWTLVDFTQINLGEIAVGEDGQRVVRADLPTLQLPAIRHKHSNKKK